MSRQENDPSRIELRKYQNRRYYDVTHKKHVNLGEIHRMICDGHDIRVVDAQTEQDITSKVLTQILLEYEPVKLDHFSSDLLAQVIRVNDKILKDFVEMYFAQAFDAFCQSKSHLEDFVRRASFLPNGGLGSGGNPFSAMNPFAAFFHGGHRSRAESNHERDLAQELAELKRQVEELKKRK